MQKAGVGTLIKGAKKLGMKVKTKLNERRMKKQLDKLGYDPDATSGPNTLSKIIEREAKKNRKAKGGTSLRKDAYKEATKKAAGKRITASDVKKAEKDIRLKRYGVNLIIKGKAEGGIARGGRAAIRGIKFSGVK
tara:strand:+ start:1157 stop:1561 length:405 start_codon:yes stop_codon:yes gene_type:complete